LKLLRLLLLLLKLLLLRRWGCLACYGMQVEMIYKYEARKQGCISARHCIVFDFAVCSTAG